MKKITVLPFGSILTQLPLIIIGALYMLYLGLCAVNRSKEAPLTSASETNEHFVEAVSPAHSIDYFLIAGLQKDKCDAHAEPVSNNYIYISDFNIALYSPDQDIISYTPYYCLFSRPPPFIS